MILYILYIVNVGRIALIPNWNIKMFLVFCIIFHLVYVYIYIADNALVYDVLSADVPFLINIKHVFRRRQK